MGFKKPVLKGREKRRMAARVTTYEMPVIVLSHQVEIIQIDSRLVFSTFYEWGNWDTKWLSHAYKITQLRSGTPLANLVLVSAFLYLEQAGEESLSWLFQVGCGCDLGWGIVVCWWSGTNAVLRPTQLLCPPPPFAVQTGQHHPKDFSSSLSLASWHLCDQPGFDWVHSREGNWETNPRGAA